jgi:hypothetical protein
MRSLEEIAAELLALPSESRVFLADKLVASLREDTDAIVQTVWKNEDRRRRTGLYLAAIDERVEGALFRTESDNLITPFLWDVVTQGGFSICELLKSTGNIIPIEIDDFRGDKEFLRNVDRWEEFLKQNHEYLTQEEDILNTTLLHMQQYDEQERAELINVVNSQSAIMNRRYLTLLELLRSHVTELRAYKVIKYDRDPICEESKEEECPIPLDLSTAIFESFNILVGKVTDNCWIGISPVSRYNDYPLTRPTPEKFIPQRLCSLTPALQELETKLKPILDRLTFIVRQFYNHYYEENGCACEFAETEAKLIDRLLHRSNYLRTWEFEGIRLGEGDERREGFGDTEDDEEYSWKQENKLDEIDGILRAMLRDVRVHILGNQSIFDIYAIGRSPDGDWLGVSTKAVWTG